jgi:uroporphyrinogen decarboxylase
MTSRDRMLSALAGKTPDRLPVTTHHLMPYFLNKYLSGMSGEQFFAEFGLDRVDWAYNSLPDSTRGEYWYPSPEEVPGDLPRWICSDNWRITSRPIANSTYTCTAYEIATPQKTLTMALQGNEQTVWITERLLKEKADIELIARYAPRPICDIETVNRYCARIGDAGIVRGSVPSFEIFGQPGCWQDAACLYGIEQLIYETFDDPRWVKELLVMLRDRKAAWVKSTVGAKFDLIEHGGGDASSTVISPAIFDEFVAPYDSELIRLAQSCGQKIVYHTCGGMMPILERIADMGPEAMETFTPASLGGDTDLAEAKRRIGDRVCFIGGFDQCRYLAGCSEAETRRAVRDCFNAAGAGGGLILSPSDHFFDAEIKLIHAFADEARKCTY